MYICIYIYIYIYIYSIASDPGVWRRGHSFGQGRIGSALVGSPQELFRHPRCSIGALARRMGLGKGQTSGKHSWGRYKHARPGSSWARSTSWPTMPRTASRRPRCFLKQNKKHRNKAHKTHKQHNIYKHTNQSNTPSLSPALARAASGCSRFPREELHPPTRHHYIF